MLQFILFSFLVVLLISNFSKGFMIIFVLSTWLSCFSFLGQNMMAFLSLAILIIFVFKYGLKNLLSIIDFPFKKPFLLIAVSLVISNFFAETKHYPTVIISIISELFIVFVFWYLLNKEKNITMKRLVNYSFAYALIIVCYTIFETITRSNPIVEYLNQVNAYSFEGLITEVRFGLKRSQSIFAMHTTNGAVSMLLFVFCYYAYAYGYFKKRKFLYYITFLLVFVVFSTGARSVILGLVISLLSVVYIGRVKLKYILGFLVSIIFVYLCFRMYLNEILNSFIDTKNVQGSNSDMRAIQFGIAFMFLQQSLWIGNGISYTWEFALPLHEELLGAESLWIPIMIDRGLLGIFSFVLFFVSLIRYCIKNESTECVFVILGFLVANTLSSLPNFSIIYISAYIYVIIMMKKNSKYEYKRVLSKNSILSN